MSEQASYPTANGKRFTLEVDLHADVPPYMDYAHTDRLDNFTVMEVAGKSRCHGMHLEGTTYPITPIGMHYLLIHHDIPEIDESTYQVTVAGLVKNKLTLDMNYFRGRPKVTIPATMECCGNGRASQKWRLWAHVPWNHDAIGTAEWTGTPLRGVLEDAGVLDDAVEILFTGLDKGIQGAPDGAEVQYFQRSLTVDYVMNPENDVLLCYEINGIPVTPAARLPAAATGPRLAGHGQREMDRLYRGDIHKAHRASDEVVQLRQKRRRPQSHSRHLPEDSCDDDPARHPRFRMPGSPFGGDGFRRAAWAGVGWRASDHGSGRQPRRWKHLVAGKARQAVRKVGLGGLVVHLGQRHAG